MNSNSSIQYAAYIENVKEVALFGAADLVVWREVLKPEKLSPFDYQCKAVILISAPHLVWKGARFNELSISIAVSERYDGCVCRDFRVSPSRCSKY